MRPMNKTLTNKNLQKVFFSIFFYASMKNHCRLVVVVPSDFSSMPRWDRWTLIIWRWAAGGDNWNMTWLERPNHRGLSVWFQDVRDFDIQMMSSKAWDDRHAFLRMPNTAMCPLNHRSASPLRRMRSKRCRMKFMRTPKRSMSKIRRVSDLPLGDDLKVWSDRCKYVEAMVHAFLFVVFRVFLTVSNCEQFWQIPGLKTGSIQATGPTKPMGWKTWRLLEEYHENCQSIIGLSPPSNCGKWRFIGIPC